MHIALIAAMAKNRVIGKDNQMPWHLPEDLRHFKHVTMGKPIIMGRRTFESIGRPLPGRQNIVVSRQCDFAAARITLASSLDDALTMAQPCEEIMVIGGGQLYAEAMAKAEVLYLTEIDLEVAGDTWFPDWEKQSWIKISSESGISTTGLEYRFIKLVKKC